jgi:1-deoxy-D-xylulose-5-phosphate synthase
MVVPATLFEKFGFNYIGPIDGHDLDSLIPTLENIKGLKGPQFLHVVTKKGQGYKLAEADPWPTTAPASSTRPWAWSSRLHPSRPSPRCSANGCATWRRKTAPGGHHAGHARRLGHGGVPQALPERYYDVGIAEQHAVTFAAACEGVKPVVAIYSTFLQRAYDQLIHDVALQNLPVVFALDRAGWWAPTAPRTRVRTTSPLCAAFPT